MTAGQTGKRLGDWIHDRMALSAYLAEKWEEDYADNEPRYASDAAQFVERFPGILVALILAASERAILRRNRAIEASRKQYRELFEQAPVAYFSVQPDATIERANEVAVSITGLPGEELIGRSVYDLYADDVDPEKERHLPYIFPQPMNTPIRMTRRNRIPALPQFRPSPARPQRMASFSMWTTKPRLCGAWPKSSSATAMK